METRLMRSSSDKFIGGVAGGLAVYLGVDPVLVRIAIILLSFSGGIGIPLYFILLIVMPSDEDVVGQSDGKDVDEFGNVVQSAHEPNRAHPQGPTITAILFIAFGIYFLLNNFGVGWVEANLIWPILLIGGGLYLVWRNRKG